MKDINNKYTEITELIIPSTITCIGNHQFQYFNNITSIEIPNSVVSIGEDAFFGCNSLVKIKISENFTNYFDSENLIKRYNEKKYSKEDGYIIFD